MLSNGSQLTNTSNVSDLGILGDSHLTFNLHISNILTKATHRAGVFSVDFHHATLHLLENYLKLTFVQLLNLIPTFGILLKNT